MLFMERDAVWLSVRIICEVWFDKKRQCSKRVDWNGVCLADGSQRGTKPREAMATRAIIPPRWIRISAMERSICLAWGGPPPGRLQRMRGKRGRLKLEYKLHSLRGKHNTMWIPIFRIFAKHKPMKWLGISSWRVIGEQLVSDVSAIQSLATPTLLGRTGSNKTL